LGGDTPRRPPNILFCIADDWSWPHASIAGDKVVKTPTFDRVARKGWGPGRNEPGGRTQNPAGPQYKDFAAFLEARPEGTPFCFWFGSHDPHRGYQWESGVQSGMNAEDVEVPACLPPLQEQFV